MNIIGMKAIISVLLIVIAFFFWMKRTSIQLTLEKYNEKFFLSTIWVAFRVIPFLAIYIVANYSPQSDVSGFWEEASQVFQGKVVYRDFWCPYSPLYPYFLASWISLWYNSKMIIVVMIIMDGLALFLTNRFYQSFYSKGKRLWLSLLYSVLPGSLMLCVIGGQEDIWMWVMVLLAVLAKQKTNSTFVYSTVLAIGLLLTKAIFVLVIIPLFLIERRKVAFTIPMGIIGSVTLAILLSLVGWGFTQPLDEAEVLRAPNLLSVLNPIFNNSIGTGAGFWNWTALVTSIVLGSRVLLLMRDDSIQQALSRFWVVVFATMMIVQQSAYSNYLFLFLLPLVFGVMDWENKRQVYTLFILNILCVIHPSWWWRIGMPKYEGVEAILSEWQYTVDYMLQVAIVILTLLMVKWAYPSRKIHVRVSPPELEMELK